jgi:hypothetical protein
MGVSNRLLTLDCNAATLRANTADDMLRNPTLPTASGVSRARRKS